MRHLRRKIRPPGLEKQLLCDETFDLLAETNGKRYRPD
jgi:hypothetical protein